MREVALWRVVDDVLQRRVERGGAELHRKGLVLVGLEIIEERRIDRGRFLADDARERGSFCAVAHAGRSNKDPFSTFDHTVVVMFENRSLDSLLGYLYAPGTVPRNQTFNGLAGADHKCPVPPYINDGNAYVSARISPGTDADMMNPNPDPGEEYQHVNTQLYSTVDPPDNAFRTAPFMVAPWNNPKPAQAATMDGFVQDYCNNFVATNGRKPTFARDDERLIYALVTEMNETRTLSQPTYDRAVALLGLDLVIELITSIGFYTMVAIMLNGFDAPVPGGERPLP